MRRDFGGAEAETLFRMLGETGAEAWHREGERVRLAVLKLAGGRLEGVREALEVANRDYRDVIAWAEYPELMELGFVGVGELEEEAVRELKERDAGQYEAWLRAQ